MNISPEVWVTLVIAALGNFWLLARTVGDRDRRLLNVEKETGILRKTVALNNIVMHEFLLKYDREIAEDHRNRLTRMLEESEANDKD